MRRGLLLPLVLALIALCESAAACSCRIGPTEERFRDHSVVFVGEVVSLRRDARIPDQPFEDLVFLVKTAFKGVKAGQRVRFHTMVLCCACGVSVKEMSTMVTGWKHVRRYDVLPDSFQTWLVFAGGHEPYSLFLCSHSQPFDPKRGSDDYRWLEAHARGR